jgi:hypothetical protein
MPDAVLPDDGDSPARAEVDAEVAESIRVEITTPLASIVLEGSGVTADSAYWLWRRVAREAIALAPQPDSLPRMEANAAGFIIEHADQLPGGFAT